MDDIEVEHAVADPAILHQMCLCAASFCLKAARMCHIPERRWKAYISGRRWEGLEVEAPHAELHAIPASATVAAVEPGKSATHGSAVKVPGVASRE